MSGKIKEDRGTMRERCRQGQTRLQVSRREGGAPKGSLNALKSGAHVKIFDARLMPEEREYMAGVPLDPLVVLQEELKMYFLRKIMNSLLAAEKPKTFNIPNSGELARFYTSDAFFRGTPFNDYIGAAFEYKFDGKARASVWGHDIKTAKLEGETGIGEVGLIMKPFDKYP